MLCCVGLTVEAWFALVAANHGTDVIDFFIECPELNLIPDDLEVPVLEAVQCPKTAVHWSLKAAIDAATPSDAVLVPPTLVNDSQSQQQPASKNNDFRKLMHSTSQRARPNRFAGDPGRAATVIQAAWKGWRDRRKVAALLAEECSFLGIPLGNTTTQQAQHCSKVLPTSILEESTAARQEKLRKEYEAAKMDIETLLKTQEGPFMASEERSLVHSWLEERLDKATGKWPEVPLTGSFPGADYLNTSTQQLNTKSKPLSSKSSPQPGNALQQKTPTGSTSSKAPPAAAASTVSAGTSSTPPTPSFATEMATLIQSWKEVWEQRESSEMLKDKSAGVSFSLAGLEDDQTTTSALESLPLPRRGSSVDAIDLDLLAKSLRPQVRESVRHAVREQARHAAITANASLPTAAPADQGSSGDKNKSEKTGKQGPASAPRSVEKPGSVDKKGSAGEQQPSEKKKKELPPPLDLDSVFKVLSENGLAHACPSSRLSEFMGEACYVQEAADKDSGRPALVKKVKSGGKAANAAAKNTDPLLAYPEMSFAQIRQILTVQCVLPLLAKDLHPRLTTRPITALIYGPRGSGKTMLAEAVAIESGSTFFDLSPASMAGKFPGKAADVAVEMVFTAAKATAPSVIYIDEVENVFIRDAKRGSGLAGPDGEPPSRIRKELLIQVANLKPNDGVLVLCVSSEPHACVGADEEELIAFLQMLVEVPLPRDCTRCKLLAAFAAEYGVQWAETTPSISSPQKAGQAAWQQLSLATRLTEGFTTGQLKKMVGAAAEMWKMDKKDFLGRLIEAAAAEVPPSSAELAALMEWTARAHVAKKSGLEGKSSSPEKKSNNIEKKSRPN